MKKKNHFNIHTIMAVATTVCMLASGCSSAASTSDSAVPDTAKPVITIADKEVKATVNGKLNISTNVKVEDDTDGRLKKVDKLEDGKAGYTVDDTKVDMTKAGTYVVAVTAVDSAGNKAKSSFDVVVSEAKVEEKTDTEKTSGAGKEEKKETSSAKSGNSDKVTSSSTAKPSTGNSSSSGSKPSSGTSNSASTSKPSAGSSGSNKPSTGGSSSGSGSAAKPSGGSGSSGSSGGSSGGSTPAPKPKPDCTTETIYHPAETHTVTHPAETTTVEHPAETRWFIDMPAHDEPIYEGALVCNTCGKAFLDVGEFDYHTLADDTSPCFLSSWHDDMVVVGTNHIPEQGHNEVVKQAWTETVVVKDAWTETVVDKPAWTETKEVCG